MLIVEMACIDGTALVDRGKIVFYRVSPAILRSDAVYNGIDNVKERLGTILLAVKQIHVL
jgi:hypothetical protein